MRESTSPIRATAWNIAEVGFADTNRVLARRFARLAFAWGLAFAAIVVMSFVGLGVAEAAPVGRLAGVPGPFVPALIAGMLGGAGGLTALLWKRMLDPKKVRPSRAVK